MERAPRDANGWVRERTAGWTDRQMGGWVHGGSLSLWGCDCRSWACTPPPASFQGSPEYQGMSRPAQNIRGCHVQPRISRDATSSPEYQGMSRPAQNIKGCHVLPHAGEQEGGQRHPVFQMEEGPEVKGERGKFRITQEAGLLGSQDSEPGYPIRPGAPPPTAPGVWSHPLGHRVMTGAGDHAWSLAGTSTATAHPCPAQASHSWEDKGQLGQRGSGVSLVGIWPLQDVSNGFWRWGSATGGCKSD